VIFAKINLCPQIEGRIQGRTVRLASAAVSKPIRKQSRIPFPMVPRQPKHGGPDSRGRSVVEGFIPSCRSRLERPEDAWIVPGPNHSEHIGAGSIAPPSTGPRAFAHAAIVSGGSHRSISEAPPRRDAGLTAPDVRIPYLSRNAAVDCLFFPPYVCGRGAGTRYFHF
jgi:hypothetical protein